MRASVLLALLVVSLVPGTNACFWQGGDYGGCMAWPMDCGAGHTCDQSQCKCVPAEFHNTNTSVTKVTKEAGEIAAGVVKGFMGAAPDVLACIAATVTVVRGLEDAIKDLEAQEENYRVLKGLFLLAEAFKTLPGDLKLCKAAESDVEEIIIALKNMSSPSNFIYWENEQDLRVNHANIFHEIHTAITDYHDQKWLDFGIQVGTALHKVVTGPDAQFREFEQKYGRIYSQEERSRRLLISIENLKFMQDVRSVEHGTASYSHLTPFADLTRDEFAQRNGFRTDLSNGAQRIQQDSPLKLAALLNTSDIPESFDWVEKGAVNEVKNQGTCGSCWAFTTVANIEGAGFVENNKLLSLSEQELVDCDKKTGDVGCKGGLPSNAYKDMIANKIGLELESDYPYTASDGQCTATQSNQKVFIKDFVKVSRVEDQMTAALIKYGPLAIGINSFPMQFYRGGVARPWSILCNPKQLDHGVTIVGFGVDKSAFWKSSFGRRYWKIRNSWGPEWGEKGYYRIIRNEGACGLNTMVTSATGITLNSADGAVIV